MPATPSSTPVSVGDVVDNRYELHALVSRRGRETMFRGRQLSLNRDVAVKVLNGDADADDARRFFNEARAVAQLEHPNCMQVLEYGETPAGVKFIAINSTGGHPLSLDLGVPIPEEQATLYMRDILQGLEHAHSRGVAHRELSPEAIIISGGLDGHGRAVITEFGGAAGTEVSPALTLGEMLSGNPCYASPEQAAGLSADESSDLYSAGIIFFELLTGHPPFQHEDPISLFQMHMEQPLPELPGISAGLVDIVHKLAAKQRHQRYATASEALDDLERHLNAASSSTSVGLLAEATVDASSPPVITNPGIVVQAPTLLAPPARQDRRGLWLGVAAATVGAIAIGVLAAASGRSVDGAGPNAAVAARSVAASGPLGNGADGSLALLAQVNDSTDPLDYGPRHQALDLLAASKYAKNVDTRLQTKLDLIQASTAPDPCETYATALAKAREDDGAYFSSTLASVEAPQGCEPGAPRDAEADEEASGAVEAAAQAEPVVVARVAPARRPAPERRQRSSRPQPPTEPKPAPPSPRKASASDGGIVKLGSGLKGIAD